MKSADKQSSSLKGWLVTKKVGKDDARIKKDKERAAAARKQKLNRGKVPASKSRKRNCIDDDSDEDSRSFIAEDDSIHEFIASDGNENLSADASSSDDEDFIVNRKSRNKLSVRKRKTSRQQQKKKSHRTGRIIEIDSGEENTKLRKEDISSGSELDDAAFPKATTTSSTKKNTVRSPYFSKISEEEEKKGSDSSDIEVLSLRKSSTGTPSLSPSSRDAYKKDLDGIEKDDRAGGGAKVNKGEIEIIDDEDCGKIHSSQSGLYLGVEELSDDHNDAESEAIRIAVKRSLQDTPSPKRSRPLKRMKKKKEEEKRGLSAHTAQKTLLKGSKLSTNSKVISKPAQAHRRHVILEDSDSDDDDVQPSEEAEEIIIEIESESEDDNIAEEEDEYKSADSKEATSILETANSLSTKILSRMSQWCHTTESTDKPVAANNTGMIVKGALSINTINSQVHELLVLRDDVQTICKGLKLADYQLLGVNWMALLNTMTVDGKKKKNDKNCGESVNGVLADEMGLGKTVQTIAFLAWLKYKDNDMLPSQLSKKKLSFDSEKADENDTDSVQFVEHTGLFNNNSRPHIIIVPASVLSNWMNEFEKFCPDLTVVKYHGNMNERKELQQHLRQCLPTALNRRPLDVVLTTFSYFSAEKGDDRSFLRKFKFDYMVVDEAHCLKNARGLRYKNMDKFTTSHRLLLTGTPVQNSPKELMSLICFLMPLFSQRKSVECDDDDEKEDVSARMVEHFVTSEEGVTVENAYSKLKQLFSPFVLRRKKSDVLSQLLPPKTKKLELVPFDDATRKVYDSVLSDHLALRENATTKEIYSVTKHIFSKLRKAANHPLLLRTRHTSDEAVKHLSLQMLTANYFGRDASCTMKLVLNELKEFSDYDLHIAALELIEENPLRRSELERYILQESDLFCSPKFARLKILLPELISENHRILIFSQWTRCLDLLGSLMEVLGLKFLRLDGQTDIPERQVRIDKFNNDPSIPIFLLSTRAGGMGINLTSADTCIIHDLDFNPFNDLQAEDRCHRIGQKKKVTIIKMVTSDTVDASIYSMQERKSRMNEAILDSGHAEPKATAEKKEINVMMQDAMERFLSPTKKKKVL